MPFIYYYGHGGENIGVGGHMELKPFKTMMAQVPIMARFGMQGDHCLLATTTVLTPE